MTGPGPTTPVLTHVTLAWYLWVMSTRPILLGISDDHTDCMCCGKRGLKRTAALDLDGDVVFYGLDCAARALRGRNTAAARKGLERDAAAIARARRILDAGHSAADVLGFLAGRQVPAELRDGRVYVTTVREPGYRATMRPL